MAPHTPQEWLDTAKERAADADEVCKFRPTSVGSVYLAGYAIECSLKALLQKKGIPFPSSGTQGHNLQALWKALGFQFSDIKDKEGTQTFFLTDWSTDLRYETSLTTNRGFQVKQLVNGARILNSWIEDKIKRSKPRKKK